MNRSASTSPSVLSSWVRTVIDALEDHGHATSPLLDEVRLSAADLQDPSARVPLADVLWLWGQAAALSRDPAFGLRIPKYITPTTFHALGYAVLASATLGEALERITRYGQMVTDSGSLKLEHRGDDVILYVITDLQHTPGSVAFRDSVMSVIVRAMRLMTKRQLAVRSVTLHRGATCPLAAYERFYGCEVLRRGDDMLRFDARELARVLDGTRPELANHNDEAVRKYLARAKTGTLVDRTRAVISELSAREASPTLVARRLGLGLRSLQRGLRELGTSYEDVLQDVRCERACAYLREKRYPVSEVADLIGYDSFSSFARAFKRWKGTSPSAYAGARRGP
jgi:AraC-like DNA-binding protein